MKLLEINARSQELLTCLCQVWESSVRATHHFLSEENIRSLAVYVPQALAQVPVLVVAFSDQGIPVGFMGIDGHQAGDALPLPRRAGDRSGPAAAPAGHPAVRCHLFVRQ